MVGRAWFVLLAIRSSRLSRTLTHRHPEHKRHQRHEAAGTEAVRSDKDIVNLYKSSGLRRLALAFCNPLSCMFNGIYYSIDIQ